MQHMMNFGFDKELGTMQSIKFCWIQEGAKAFYGVLLELLQDVEGFQNQITNARPFLSDHEDEQQSQLRRLQNQLQALPLLVIQMKSDVAKMGKSIKLMLSNSNTEMDSFLSANAEVKLETTDEPESLFENSEISERDMGGTGNQFMLPSQSTGGSVTKQTKPVNKRYRKQVVNSTYSKSPKCHYCDEKITSRYHHMQKCHPGMKNFPCNLCDKAFDDYKEFQSHSKSHKNTHVTNFKCDLCNRVLRSIQSMSGHMVSHGTEKPYVCHVCGQNFLHKKSLAKCKHGLIANRVSSSTECVKSFAPADLLNRHLDESCYSKEDVKTSSAEEKEESRIVADMSAEKHEIFSCSICSKTFSKQWLLQQHMNLHTGKTPFKCEFCYREFHTSKAKGTHKYLKHSGTFRLQGFKCKICGEKCRSGLGREAHYLTHTQEERNRHNIVIKMTECDVCGKIVRKNYLTNHKLTHLSKDSYICEICGKGFKRAGGLKTHSIVHMSPQDKPLLKPRLPQLYSCREKNHVCNVCGKAFPIKSQLILHNRVHTGERPYRCEVCGKSFVTAQSLKGHEVVHTKVRAFKCNICGDAFTFQTNLKRHLAIHKGQKPFQCDFCGKRFVQKVHLVCHRRIHTGEKPFQCSECGKKFSDPSTLYKHKTRHEKGL